MSSFKKYMAMAAIIVSAAAVTGCIVNPGNPPGRYGNGNYQPNPGNYNNQGNYGNPGNSNNSGNYNNAPAYNNANNTASGGIPFFNATCPGNIEIHSDQGGPVYFNGQQGNIKKVNNNYYEASGAGITLSIATNPDGSMNLSYTGRHGANGICQTK